MTAFTMTAIGMSPSIVYPKTTAMKRILTTAFLAVTCAAVTTWAAEDIKPLYEKECSKCHGLDGKGQTKTGQLLKARDYTDPKVQATLKDEEGVKAIKEGLKKDAKVLMKPAPTITDEQAKALVAYMRKFEKK